MIATATMSPARSSNKCACRDSHTLIENRFSKRASSLSNFSFTCAWQPSHTLYTALVVLSLMAVACKLKVADRHGVSPRSRAEASLLAATCMSVRCMHACMRVGALLLILIEQLYSIVTIKTLFRSPRKLPDQTGDGCHVVTTTTRNPAGLQRTHHMASKTD